MITLRNLGRFRRRREETGDEPPRLPELQLAPAPGLPAAGNAEPPVAHVEDGALASVMMNEEGKILGVNTAATELLGLSQSKLLNLSFALLLARGESHRFLGHLEQCRSTPGRRVVTELRLQQHTRKTSALELATVATRRAAHWLFQTVIIDVTERREREQALEEAKEFAESIVETVQEPLIILNRQLKVVSANRAFTEAFGKCVAEVKGRLFETLFDLWWSGNELRMQLESVLSADTPVQGFQVEVPTSTGPRRVFLLSARRLHRKPALPPLILIALQDVTELKRIEEKLQLANGELEQRVQARTRALQESNEQMEAFCYSIAHDLRAPLRAMKGFSQVLAEDFGPIIGDEGREYTERIVAAAERMDDLIHDLLDYGRLNTIQLATEQTNWEQVFSSVLAHLDREIEESKAAIIKGNPLPAVRGHSLVLQVALTNLVANALKFVAPGVTPHIHIWSEQRGSMHRLWVEDNGIGIADEHQQRIFEVFQRLHTAETYPGTGIGLAIVRKGIERIGGAVGIESQVGKGSRFWIDLPAG